MSQVESKPEIHLVDLVRGRQAYVNGSEPVQKALEAINADRPKYKPVVIGVTRRKKERARKTYTGW